MSIQIKTPNITTASDREKLAQIQSYLYQMAQQLQWAFNTIETGTISAESSASSPAGKTGKVTVDAETTFATLKNLIIKSADIVDAYYEKINSRLSGEYVAKSDFGEYTELTEQQIEASSVKIEQIYTDLQQIITEIDALDHSLVETRAYINSGLLYYGEDGLPVYGLEIGQRSEIDGAEVFNKYARFTSEKLAFYDSNDNEVAYISDKKLYITHVEVTGSFTISGFVDTVRSDRSVVTKWMEV